jgi:hypothetical protein
MLVWLLYCLSLLFKVCHWSGLCCGCYIVYLFCLWFERGMVHAFVGFIVYHYCLRFDRRVVHVVVIFSTITV